MNAFSHSLTHLFMERLQNTCNVSGSVLCAGDTKGSHSATKELPKQVPKKLVILKCGDGHDRIIKIGCAGGEVSGHPMSLKPCNLNCCPGVERDHI